MMYAMFVGDPAFSLKDLDARSARDEWNSLAIMAEVFLAIARAHGYRPRYRVKAGSGRPVVEALPAALEPAQGALL